MTQRFVIRNQDGYYLSKSKEWVDGRNPAVVVNLLHYDQALNELIEANSKDIWVRGSVLEVEANQKGRVQLEIIVPEVQEQLPVDLAEEVASNDVDEDVHEDVDESGTGLSHDMPVPRVNEN